MKKITATINKKILLIILMLMPTIAFGEVSGYAAFGLNFGGSEAENPYVKTAPFQLNKKWDDIWVDKCEKEIFNLNWLGPYGQPADLDAQRKK